MVNPSLDEIGARAVLHAGPTIYVRIMPRHPFLAVKIADAVLMLRGTNASIEGLQIH
jgi:hypothetical protein